MKKSLRDESSKGNVFYLSESPQGLIIKKYNSLTHMRAERYLNAKAKLKGCFERDGIIGQIKLKSFSIKVKSLDNNDEEMK